MNSKKKVVPGELAKNKKAFHNFEISETFEAGIVLKGTEIKSLRNHGASLVDAYAIVKDNELWLINSSIAPYKHGNIHNHPEKRKRKLLMHKNEIFRLNAKIKEKALTLVPLAFYLKNGIVKVKLALAKGKKVYDKRSSLKEKEAKKSIKGIINS